MRRFIGARWNQESPGALLDDGELDDVRATLRELASSLRRPPRHGRRTGADLLSSPRARARFGARASEAPPHHLHAVIEAPQRDGVPCDLQLRPDRASVLLLLTRCEDTARDASAGSPPAWRSHAGQGARRRRSREVIVCGSRSRCGLSIPARCGSARMSRSSSRPRSGAAQPGADGRCSPRASRRPRWEDVRRVVRVRRARIAGSRHFARADGAPRDRFPPAHGGRVGSRRVSLRSERCRRTATRRATLRAFTTRDGVCDGVSHVLMARDLSRDGLRIDPTNGWRRRRAEARRVGAARFRAAARIGRARAPREIDACFVRSARSAKRLRAARRAARIARADRPRLAAALKGAQRTSEGTHAVWPCAASESRAKIGGMDGRRARESTRRGLRRGCGVAATAPFGARSRQPPGSCIG